jgi:P2-related tail formation protein
MTKIDLTFWLSGDILKRLKTAAEQFWNKVQDYAQWPQQQLDALTCHATLLKLLAWERDVDRLPNEPLSVFRLRVKYAYLNARDAGSVAGFKRIFARLNIDIIEMQERNDQVNWDVITILITDSELQANEPLITSIIDQYGRTCRRYELTTYDVTTVNIAVIEFSGSQEFTEVEYVPT